MVIFIIFPSLNSALVVISWFIMGNSRYFMVKSAGRVCWFIARQNALLRAPSHHGKVHPKKMVDVNIAGVETFFGGLNDENIFCQANKVDFVFFEITNNFEASKIKWQKCGICLFLIVCNGCEWWLFRWFPNQSPQDFSKASFVTPGLGGQLWFAMPFLNTCQKVFRNDMAIL